MGRTDNAARRVARTSGLARRYASDVSPLSGLREPTPVAFADLAALVGPEEHVGLMTAEPLQVPGDWQIGRSRPIEQMICTELMVNSGLARTSFSTPVALGAADVPEMLALAVATEPGPFLPETIRMGRYWHTFPRRTADGHGRGAAAVGRLHRNQRGLHPSGLSRPRPCASAFEFLVAQTLAEGNIPFLHVKEENGARLLYEKIGFRVRRTMQLTVIGRG